MTPPGDKAFLLFYDFNEPPRFRTKDAAVYEVVLPSGHVPVEQGDYVVLDDHDPSFTTPIPTKVRAVLILCEEMRQVDMTDEEQTLHERLTHLSEQRWERERKYVEWLAKHPELDEPCTDCEDEDG